MNTNTIITPEDIRRVRPVANNIADLTRIAPYIGETETLDLMPAIGAGLYGQFTGAGFAAAMQANGSATVTTAGGKTVTVTSALWEEILDGCYYTHCTGTHYSAGLRAATAYLAYARMLPNQPINVTAFGVVNKTTALSEPVEEATLFRAASTAQRIGLEYLRQSVEHMRSAGLIDEAIRPAKRYSRFKAIG